MIFLCQLPQHLDQFRIKESDPGKVDGDGIYIFSITAPFPDDPAYMLRHIVVQLDDKADFLEYRDKFPWRDQTGFRMVPAHQRLGAKVRICGKGEFGLKKHDKLLLFHRPTHVIHDRRLFRFPLFLPFIIKSKTGGIQMLALFTSDEGSDVHFLNGQVRLRHDVGADRWFQQVIFLIFV